jgi:hypothetical protein
LDSHRGEKSRGRWSGDSFDFSGFYTKPLPVAQNMSFSNRRPFRQQKPGDWEDVMVKTQDALRDAAR